MSDTPRAADVRHLLRGMRPAVDREARTLDLAVSSEAPYERIFGTEVLDHTADAVDLSRLGAGDHPLLENHDPARQVGVIARAWLDKDRRLRVQAKVTRNASGDELLNDAEDGIRTLTSIGYQILRVQVTERNAAGELSTRDLDGDAFSAEMRAAYGNEWHRAGAFQARDGDGSGEPPLVRVTRWMPYEASVVSIPADPSVGLGRSAAEGPAASTTQPQPNPLPKVITMSDTSTLPADLQAARDDAAKAVRAQVSEIIAIGDSYKAKGGDKVAAEAVRAGMNVDQFRAKLLEHLSSQPLPAAIGEVGLSAKEVRRYSLTRALRALVDRDWRGAGFEKEVSDEIMKRQGLSQSANGGFYVPYEFQKRDLTAGTPSAGGYLVATDNLASSFIDLVRNRTTLAQAGATMLTGLVGNVTIPKQTGANSATWLANESSTISESNATFGQLALSPKHVGAYQEIGRQLMMQSDPSVDMLIMNDMARVIAIAIDLAGFEGSGASGQPTGISGTAGIGSVTGTSIDYAKVLEFQNDVAGGNLLAANCAYITTPAVAALLMQRVKFTSTASPLWEGGVLDGNMVGFRAMATNQVTAASMVFGDFSQVVIGEWGVLELALNPYANFTAAISGIRAIQTVDVGVRYGGAFSRATSIT